MDLYGFGSPWLNLRISMDLDGLAWIGMDPLANQTFTTNKPRHRTVLPVRQPPKTKPPPSAEDVSEVGRHATPYQ